jgi:hypothetical protein
MHKTQEMLELAEDGFMKSSSLWMGPMRCKEIHTGKMSDRHARKNGFNEQ